MNKITKSLFSASIVAMDLASIGSATLNPSNYTPIDQGSDFISIQTEQSINSSIKNIKKTSESWSSSY